MRRVMLTFCKSEGRADTGVTNINHSGLLEDLSYPQSAVIVSKVAAVKTLEGRSLEHSFLGTEPSRAAELGVPKGLW